MSRAPPFPTRRAQSPSLTNGNVPTSNVPFSAPGGPSATRPLQIARPPSRPTTPSNSSILSSSPRGIPNTAPGGPSRPQRSELRSRVSEYSESERASSSSRDNYRDSIMTTRSDYSQPFRSRGGGSSNPNTPGKSRPQPQRMRSAPSEETETTTPIAMSSVLSAFQSAGARKRTMTNGSEEMEYQRDRQKEIEAEKVRQQRIRDKVTGRRVNGKARAGDIDGMQAIFRPGNSL